MSKIFTQWVPAAIEELMCGLVPSALALTSVLRSQPLPDDDGTPRPSPIVMSAPAVKPDNVILTVIASSIVNVRDADPCGPMMLTKKSEKGVSVGVVGGSSPQAAASKATDESMTAAITRARRPYRAVGLYWNVPVNTQVPPRDRPPEDIRRHKSSPGLTPAQGAATGCRLPELTRRVVDPVLPTVPRATQERHR